MLLDADAMIDRRRTRRKLTFWRVVAFLLAAVALIVGGGYALKDKLGDQNQPHIARIEISGVIMSDPKFIEMLKELGKNENVKGVVVAIDSPGGTTTGGEELYDGLLALGKKKPLAASVGTLAASAGYMAAIATDHIVAERTSITGSIGVLFQYGNVTRLLNTLGVEVNTVKSAPLKAEPSPFTYPEVPGARDMIANLVNDTYQWFVDIVAERRKFDRATALKLADGSIYSGRQALQLKLIDAIGNQQAAIDWMVESRKVPADLPVVDWRPAQPFNGFGFTGMALALASRVTGFDLVGLDSEARLDGLLSVWHPQVPEAR